VHWDIARQVSKFGMTGIIATIVHSLVLVVLVEFGGWAPTPANLVAFLSAAVVSYTGNYYWTYDSNRDHRHSIWRFVFVALIAALMNYLIFTLMVDQWNAHYLLALVVVITIVPLFSFTVQRYWVF
jgi:putative flippase GtrA